MLGGALYLLIIHTIINLIAYHEQSFINVNKQIIAPFCVPTPHLWDDPSLYEDQYDDTSFFLFTDSH